MSNAIPTDGRDMNQATAARKPKTPYRLFIEAARDVCKEVKIIKDKPRLVKLLFKDGASVLLTGLPRLNEQGSREITRDKEMTVRVMESEDIATPRSHLFVLGKKKAPSTIEGLRVAKEYPDLKEFINQVGFPVFLKPNKGSQGRGVVKIIDNETLDKQLLEFTHKDRRSIPLIQEALHGEEHRVVILFGEILLAVRRNPFEVEGDGASTIGALIKQRLNSLHAQGRRVKLKGDSPKITSCLHQQGLERGSVLEKGRTIPVIANKNLSDGAMPVMSTDYIREHYSGLAQKIYETLGVNFVGIDLIEDDRSGKIIPYVLEANANPGFGQFLNSSPNHEAPLKAMYAEVIKGLHRRKRVEKRLTRTAGKVRARRHQAVQPVAVNGSPHQRILGLIKGRATATHYDR